MLFRSNSILDIKILRKVPWEIILLFGGGFALAEGLEKSGLSKLLGQSLTHFSNMDVFLLVVIICTFLTFLTELTSNTATATTFLPILSAVAIGMNINPLILMIPATISTSFAFMMPISTPPNAVIFSSGRVKLVEMVKAGIIINIIGVIVVSCLFYLLANVAFGVDFSTAPDWLK